MLAELAEAATPSVGTEIPWVTPVIAILTMVFGGGGIAAWVKVRYDKRLGVAQQETAEHDSLASRWRAIIETQTKALLEPMTLRIGTLEGKVSTLESELAASRRKYWIAISHVRTLYAWISRHMPEDVEQTQVPAPPATLVDDI